MVVDDAIVVLENVTTHIERGSDPKQAAVHGTNAVSYTHLADLTVKDFLDKVACSDPVPGGGSIAALEGLRRRRHHARPVRTGRYDRRDPLFPVLFTLIPFAAPAYGISLSLVIRE